MLLANAPITGQVNALADWVEFNAIISEYKNFRLLNLVRLNDEEQEEENSDIATQDALNEEVLGSVIEELSLRIASLGSAYPFKFNSDFSELLFLNMDEISKGGFIYLYCLFFSHVLREDVLIIDPPHANCDRDLMQICSTYAAAGIVSGNSVSFGYPRPGNTSFLTALKITYRDFGEGVVHDFVPLGAPQSEKDARVDIIAWENTLDGLPGGRYLLGQVASGKIGMIKAYGVKLNHFTIYGFLNHHRQPLPLPCLFHSVLMSKKRVDYMMRLI